MLDVCHSRVSIRKCNITTEINKSSGNFTRTVKFVFLDIEFLPESAAAVMGLFKCLDFVTAKKDYKNLSTKQAHSEEKVMN